MLDFSCKLQYSPLDRAILNAVPRLPCNQASADFDALNKPTITVLKRSIRLRRSTILLSRSPSFPPMGSSEMQLSQTQLSIYKRIRPLLEAANMLNDELRGGNIHGDTTMGYGFVDESYSHQSSEDNQQNFRDLPEATVKLRGLTSPEIYGAKVPKAGELVELYVERRDRDASKRWKEIVHVEIEEVITDHTNGGMYLQLAQFDGHEGSPLFGSLIVPSTNAFWNLRVWRHISATQEPASVESGKPFETTVAAYFAVFTSSFISS